jgi:hypothetical protein
MVVIIPLFETKLESDSSIIVVEVVVVRSSSSIEI